MMGGLNKRNLNIHYQLLMNYKRHDLLNNCQLNKFIKNQSYFKHTFKK